MPYQFKQTSSYPNKHLITTLLSTLILPSHTCLVFAVSNKKCVIAFLLCYLIFHYCNILSIPLFKISQYCIHSLFTNTLHLHYFLGENFQPAWNKCRIIVLYTWNYIIFKKENACQKKLKWMIICTQQLFQHVSAINVTIWKVVRYFFHQMYFWYFGPIAEIM